MDQSSSPISTDAKIIVPRNSDGIYEPKTYYAYFEKDANVTFKYYAKEGGHLVDGSTTNNYIERSVDPLGTPVTSPKAEVDAESGYRFVNWTVKLPGNLYAEVSQEDTFITTRTTTETFKDVEYYANFVKDTQYVTYNYITVLDGNENTDCGKTIPSSETFNPETSTPSGSTAQANPGYRFKG